MPLYEYRCPTCRSTFELLRPMSRSTDAAPCPKGHKGAQRVVSLIASRVWSGDDPSFGPMAGGGGGCGGCAGGACACGGH